MEQLALGRNLQRQGQLKLAMQGYLDGLERCLNAAVPPAGVEAAYWLAIGDVEHEVGQWAQALALHQRGFALSEDEALQCSAKLGMAADLWAMGETALALQLQQQAMTFADLSNSPQLLAQSARVYQLQQQWPQALCQLQTAVRERGDALALHVAILDIYLCSGLSEGVANAIEQAKLALSVPADNQLREQLFRKLAQVSEYQNEFAEAANYYQSALALHVDEKKRQKRPRWLLDVELQLQQTTNEIEMDILRNKNAQQNEHVRRLESSHYREGKTQLHNLAYLQLSWPELFARAEQGQALCLLHLAVDNASHLREVFGDEVAENYFVQIAAALKCCQPDGAELISVSQSEFRLVWPLANEQDVALLTKKIQQQVKKIDSSSLPEALSVSVGATAYVAEDTLDVLQLRANLALYLAMRRGSGALVWESV